MRFRHKLVTPLTIAALLAAPVVFGACATRVYDPYYNDYHPWNHEEVVYYQQWEVETHRPHVEFARRPVEEQHAYWDWRHKRP